MASIAPSEAMVRSGRSPKELLEQKMDVWAVGPGLGTERASDILKFIDQAKQPMVIDADALNALSEKTDILKRAPGPRLLTPHPGEMKRLFDSGKMSRAGTVPALLRTIPRDSSSQRQPDSGRGADASIELQFNGKSWNGHRRNG